MKWGAICLLALSVCAADVIAAGISSSASADVVLSRFDSQRGLWVPAYDLHSSNQGTTSAQAGVSPNLDAGASGSASSTGLTLDTSTRGFYSYQANYAGYARSAAEIVLDDALYLPFAYWTLAIDVSVNYAQAGKGSQTGVELWVGGSHNSWTYSASSFPVTITTSGGNGSGYPYDPIPIRIRVWASSDADGLGTAHASSNVTLLSLRASSSGQQLTDFTYYSRSGMQYPVEGGTYAPEPGTGALLLSAGLLLLAGGVVRRRAM